MKNLKDKQIECGCGCGQLLSRYDSRGKPRKYICGHHLFKYNRYWFGKHFSEKHKKNIGEANKIAMIGNKNGRSNKGKKLSKEHREMAIKNLVPGWGKGLTKETDEKIRKRAEKMIGHPGLKGDKSPRWIKDRSKLKKRQERNDSAYQVWVKRTKKRDKNICKLKDKNCSGYNIVHHIRDWEEYPKLRYKLSNGITLCQVHHPRGRAKEEKLIPLFEKLVIESSL